MLRKTIYWIVAILLLAFAILSVPVLRNIVYSREYVQTLIHIIPPTAIIFLAIGKKAVSWIPLILSIFTEVAIYFGVAWSPLPVSVLICNSLAPALAVIASVMLIIKGKSTKSK